MNSVSRVAYLAGVLSGLSCSPSSPPEMVMTKGTIIEASNKSGRIEVQAGEGTSRTYSWKGGRETVRLWKRQERWYGSRGLYHPGGGPRVHLVVEEGQQHFCSEQEADEWLANQQSRLDYACSPTGLVVGWYKSRQPDQDYWGVNVEVWQVYIHGRRPSSMEPPGTALVHVAGVPPTMPRANFVPSEPRRINGRLYSGRAQDVMKERDIAPADVEAAIASGTKFPIPPPIEGWTYFGSGLYSFSRERGPRIRGKSCLVTVDRNGRVVFVMH